MLTKAKNMHIIQTRSFERELIYVDIQLLANLIQILFWGFVVIAVISVFIGIIVFIRFMMTKRNRKKNKTEKAPQ